MATITYRTTDEKRQRLADLAREQAVSVNKVIDELVTIALTERDAYLRFSARLVREILKEHLIYFSLNHLTEVKNQHKFRQ